ncbi:MAG: Xenobiotic-transporting ATPase, partial [Firmicutes bacterium]|nr:Xenobiotic-transporting ATPase [Bacillota bacterium]
VKVQAVSHEKRLKTGNGSENTMTVAGVEVLLPDGESLLQGLTFTLKKGEDLLITGPSGSGKSTLLRALAGIWPFCHGTMQLPTPYSVMFSPQKPYLPLGSLRDSLLYPTVGKVVDDCILENVLIRCKLNHLAGQLDRSENWSHILSLGEQQRIAFARALIMRPDWLFLDEATSGLDEDLELTMYQLVSQELQDTTVISVGHRTTLTGCHSLKLTILEKGRWQIVPITEKR